MVARFLIYVFLLPPLALFSGEFTARVNRNQVPLGESFTLSLTLTDVSAKESPSTSALKNTFIIHSQNQSSNTIITNGTMSSSTTWQYTLIPQKDGTLRIPSIKVETREGTLASNPIDIKVAKRTESSGSNSLEDSGMVLTARVTKTKPYKNEPIAYTVTLVSKQNLANLKMQKMTIEDAIIDVTGDPEIEEKIIDGVSVKTIEINYIVTPLKAGKLTIPSSIIQGGILVRKKSRLGSIFDNDFDHFSMMRQFDRLEPFALATEEVTLDVQPPVSGVTPWLPAHSLKIEEIWDNEQTFQVGEPITRSFKLNAEGVKASQLPGLNDLQIGSQSYKIYADKPEMEDQIINGFINSYRKEQYTIIPQQPGPLTLPEITVPWWDVTRHAIAYARLPSRTLEILPASVSDKKSDLTSDTEVTTPPPQQPVVVTKTNPLLYALIAGLAILLLFVVFWGITLQRKITQLSEDPEKAPQRKKEKPLPVHLKELETVTTAKEFMQFLQSYAYNQWNTQKNVTSKVVFEEARERCPTSMGDEITAIEKTLEDALYRNKEVDIKEIVQRCSLVLQQAKVTTQKKVRKEKLPDLNPS